MIYISRIPGPFELFSRPVIVNPPEYEYNIGYDGLLHRFDRLALERALREMRWIKSFTIWEGGTSIQLKFTLKPFRRLNEEEIQAAIAASIA